MSDQASSRDRRGRTAPSSGAAANEMKGPIHWPSLSPTQSAEEWIALRHYVDDLRARYPEDLDHRAMPAACWFRHPAVMGVLSAIRDFERVAYNPSSPASGAVDWHRAYRDMVALLRTFTANLRCTNTEHVASRPVPVTDEEAFAQFVAIDVARRRREAIDRALDVGADPSERG